MEVEIYSKTNCVFCDKAKMRLSKENPKIHMLDEDYKKVIKMYPIDRDWKKLITKQLEFTDLVETYQDSSAERVALQEVFAKHWLMPVA